jgi:hypothetical protein
MDLLEIGWGDVDWIGLVQDRDKWRALVNAVIRFHKKLGDSRMAAQPVASCVVTSSTKLVTSGKLQLNKKHIFIKDSLPICKSILGGTSVATTSQVCVSATLLLPT